MKIIITAISGIFALYVAYFFYALTPVSEDPAVTQFVIEKGQGFREIVENLEEKGLIRSEKAFKVYAILSGSASKLKAGNYVLSPSQSSLDILRHLVRGPEQDVEVTITEGETVKDINDKLMALGILTGKNKISQKHEGYLFPDTYRFFPNSSVDEVLKKFSDNFPQKVFNIDYKTLTMASLIEKEVPLAEDRFVVSGILWKRLQAGMHLQIDATICYAKLKSLAGCYPLRREDFSVDSQYNTYKYYGLPPGPIGNPGLSAISAARHPRQSEYWYYLSDPKSQKTVFAKTLEEHNENRLKYLGI